MSGMKRKTAKQKAESGVSLEERKKPMSFDVYKKMCKIPYKGVIQAMVTNSLHMYFSQQNET